MKNLENVESTIDMFLQHHMIELVLFSQCIDCISVESSPQSELEL